MNKLFELLEAERPMIPDSNADYDIGYNNGLVMAQAIALKHDFESVVRCKDCDFWLPEEPERCKAMKSKPYGLCNRYPQRTDWQDTTYEDDFCSYGERRTDD